MTVETDFSREAIARRFKSRQARESADRMLKRAMHMEKRAARAPAGSNERQKLLTRARNLRILEAQLRVEIIALAREETQRTTSRIEKLTDAGSRQQVRHG